VTVRADGRQDGSPKDCDYISVILFGSNIENQSNVQVPTGGFGGGAWGGGNLP
jgi:hypothetical protein